MEEELSRQVFGAILSSIGEAVKHRLEGSSYSQTNLLGKIIDSEIGKREDHLKRIIGDAMDQAFNADFRDKLRDAAAHKLARVVISKAEGEIEKRANELRADPAFRARLTLAVEAAIRGAE